LRLVAFQEFNHSGGPFDLEPLGIGANILGL
jgi:hypothetical protein